MSIGYTYTYKGIKVKTDIFPFPSICKTKKRKYIFSFILSIPPYIQTHQGKIFFFTFPYPFPSLSVGETKHIFKEEYNGSGKILQSCCFD